MSKVKRIYVEKKKDFAARAHELRHEIRHYLNIGKVDDVRILMRYDVQDISDKTFDTACKCVFAEPPVDELYNEKVEVPEGYSIFSVEYLPGQFDQRADSALQCVRMLNENEDPVIKTATTYLIDGNLSESELQAVESLCVNPVDSRITDEELPETLVTDFDTPDDVAVLENFSTMPEKEFDELYSGLGLAMTLNDFHFIREYFANEEKRNPTITEIRVLDTYWSDHCRHTTFQTELTDVKFGEGDFKEPIENTFKKYLEDRDELYKGRSDKYVCLMDMALLAAKKLKAEGKLQDQEESEEINACSIVVPVDVDGKDEEWLINFKNETHNHPTEIEPFGGAATCLGGAIRDPLSGRTYVYQAMRVTGAGDPTVPRSETIEGKLPQKKLVRDAAKGYSSYGNQIGLATGYVKEIYHPDYVAKRMEIGAVMGAAPRHAVMRETSRPGDIIILLGGETGRDGIGGATGSSKVHTTKSIDVCGAEVQKGNAPTERKLQRLFRREEVSRLIRKCNDFGAGGVSVAIGELAEGLKVDLDKVPKKYSGLDGTELAISESQERMAVVLGPDDVDEFMKYAAEENLKATEVAVVTKEPRLVLCWRGKEIVNISRAFLNTNGAHQESTVFVDIPSDKDNVIDKKIKVDDIKEKWLEILSDLNECSQRGLVEMFDSSIGAASVLMPYGGKYQRTETQSMVAKVPVANGRTNTVTIMSYGFDPYLSSWSPYHGAAWAVAESIAKVVATGGDYKKIRFTFQEYFRRMTSDPEKWSQPFTALLGAYAAQIGFGLPSIGGKDSMSGTFEHIDVPPTLVSFAVDTAKTEDIISPEFKNAGNEIVLIQSAMDPDFMPDYTNEKAIFEDLNKDIKDGNIISAYVADRNGLIPAISKMAFGNKLGVKLFDSLPEDVLFSPAYGAFVCEVPAGKGDSLKSLGLKLGKVTDDGYFTYKDAKISVDEALKAWEAPLEKVFKTGTYKDDTNVELPAYDAKDRYICAHKIATPKVFIPVFPGTNCEYDSAKAFEAAGAKTDICVFKNLTAEDIRDSLDEFARRISDAQMIMFPGGFSAGDEPDGSAKFFATAFRNEKIWQQVTALLEERDGLILGVCNGFQALIKLGLVPFGKICGQDVDSPTLTTNTLARHISHMTYTKIISNKSPWLSNVNPGDVIVSPSSHGEGRFVAPKEFIDKLASNGQIATQYCDMDGNVTMNEEFNVNGSYMAIEGITSPDGRVFGKMAHIERRGDRVAINISGEQDMKVFKAGVNYFK